MLTLKGLSVSFGEKKVLRGLGLELASGEIVGLMGASGAGKTTLLRVVAGLQAPDLPAMVPVWHGGRRPFRTGVVFQEDRLLPWRSVDQNLRLAVSALDGAARLGARRERSGLLDLFGVGGLGHELPAALSGGMRQRVALVRALLFGRELQVWDEPFQSLDAARRHQLAAFARERFKSTGATALVAGHDVAELLCLADRLLVMLPGDETTAFDRIPVGLSEAQRNPDDPAFRELRRAVEARLLGDGISGPV
jgi:ABC-type nitrate/sulfonate/bicarbonate transport system ATPase subunit